MTSPNTFTNARIEFAGFLNGADERPHYLFKIERAEGPSLYGDYTLAALEDDRHFNVEIGPFGYVDQYDAGDLNPSRRQHFSAEDCLAAERLIRSFFQPLACLIRGPYPGKPSWAAFVFDQTGSFKSLTTVSNGFGVRPNSVDLVLGEWP